MGHYAGRYRVTIQEAAERLGVKEGAIRKRIERDTIRSEKELETGRVYVYVDEPPVEEPTEHQDTGYDNGYDTSHDAGYDSGYDMLIRSQQEEIGFLRRELERKDALLLNMTEVMKALNPPASQGLSETRENGADLRPGVDPQGDDAGAETDVSRPWWRRVFGT